MKVAFHDSAREDYLYWQQTDKKILKRINTLIKDINAIRLKASENLNH